MRISDWSSDVCSSDLSRRPGSAARRDDRRRQGGRAASAARALRPRRAPLRHDPPALAKALQRQLRLAQPQEIRPALPPPLELLPCRLGGRIRCTRLSGGPGGDQEARSEEHTSELQSLMRISYAVFCLKKKKTNKQKKK